MNLNDILGIGKILPIDKLVDTISKVFGKISKPYFDKKDIDTKAYEIEKLAEAKAKEIKIIATAVKENLHLSNNIEYKGEKLTINSPKELPLEKRQSSFVSPILEERTQNRLEFQEAKKQLNIENVTTFAFEELKFEPPVTDEPLDEDWTNRFFRIVEDVSNEEMQALWGKILAGEIKHPKTYSLRTLELIRNLSKAEADTFTKVAKFAIKSGNDNFLFKTNNHDFLGDNYNIYYTDIALLIEIGLIQPGSLVNYQFLPYSKDKQTVFICGDIGVVVSIKANTPIIQMPVYPFTNSGNELIKLINSNPSLEYLSAVFKSIKTENVEVKYGHILSNNGNVITIKEMQDFE